jgi:hypothetical protein
VQLRSNVRVYPTPGRQIELAKAFGCARVVFNDGLRPRRQAREQGLPYVSDTELSQQVISQAKTTEARAWLGEVSAVLLRQALADLNTSGRRGCQSFALRSGASRSVIAWWPLSLGCTESLRPSDGSQPVVST